jgi:hypothetical protein
MNDVFGGDAFNLTSLTAAINEIAFTPTLLSQLGIFEEDGIATLDATIEYEKGLISLVPIVPRGSPAVTVNQDKRRIYSFKVPHLPETHTLLADSVQGVRAFGQESTAQRVEAQRDKILAKMRRQIDYTMEAHRLAAVKGSFYDANGTLISSHTQFGTSQVAIAFLLTTTTTKVRQKCLDVIEAMETALDGIPYTGITGMCGKTFWKELIEHASVKETYQRAQDGAALRNDPRKPLSFGDIDFMRYRGNSSVNIGDNDCWFVPRGVPEMFITRFAPANYMETVNTMGLPYYAKAKVLDYDKGVELEAQSNPLNMCTRPGAVIKGTTT